MSDDIKTVEQFLETARAETGDVWMDNHDWQHLIDMVSNLRAELEAAKLEASMAKSAAEMVRRMSAPRWIPVSERMPENFIRVLIRTHDDLVEVAYHLDLVRQWSTEDENYYHGEKYDWVTHWMPLPEPPEVE